MSKLAGKTCVITGAARGIGEAIAALFHTEGAEVVATDCDEAAIRGTASRIGCRSEVLDVRDEEKYGDEQADVEQVAQHDGEGRAFEGAPVRE